MKEGQTSRKAAMDRSIKPPEFVSYKKMKFSVTRFHSLPNHDFSLPLFADSDCFAYQEKWLAAKGEGSGMGFLNSEESATKNEIL
jgi:hypothetical protein